MDTTLEYQPFSIELRDSLETAAGSIDSRDGFLVRVRDGTTTGFGEATPLPGWTESLQECEDGLDRAMAALAEGTGADTVNTALDEIGDTPAARHGVSLALMDLDAKRGAKPLYRYLGREQRVARVPVNATISDGSPDDSAERARAAIRRGFECCKVKVGSRSVGEDVERLRRVRDAIGPGVELRVDANGAWTFDEAETALEGFANIDVSVIEQPLPADALEGHADLRRDDVSIALDEGFLAHGIDAISTADAADMIVMKPMAVGGVDVVRSMAVWAREVDIEPIVTTTIDAVVARTGAVHVSAAIPDITACGLATGELLATDLGRDPVLLEKGAAVVPQTKGLGVDDVWSER